MSYSTLLIPFGIPYALYVCVPALFPASVASWIVQAVRFAAVACSLLFFRKHYAPLFTDANKTVCPNVRKIVWITVMLPASLCAWIVPRIAIEFACHGLKGSDTLPDTDIKYIAFRMASSVLLAPLVEEFLFRGHIQAWMRQAQKTARRENCGFLKGIHLAFDEEAQELNVAATSWACALPAGLLFMLGHSPIEYPAALAYFAATALLYKITRSITACVCVHAAVNAVIGAYALHGAHFLW